MIDIDEGAVEEAQAKLKAFSGAKTVGNPNSKQALSGHRLAEALALLVAGKQARVDFYMDLESGKPAHWTAIGTVAPGGLGIDGILTNGKDAFRGLTHLYAKDRTIVAVSV